MISTVLLPQYILLSVLIVSLNLRFFGWAGTPKIVHPHLCLIARSVETGAARCLTFVVPIHLAARGRTRAAHTMRNFSDILPDTL